MVLEGKGKHRTWREEQEGPAHPPKREERRVQRTRGVKSFIHSSKKYLNRGPRKCQPLFWVLGLWRCTTEKQSLFSWR